MPPRRNSTSTDPFKLLPDGIKAFKDGWEEVSLVESQYTVCTEDEFVETTLENRYIDTFACLANSISSALAVRGKDVDSVNIFDFLMTETALAKLVDCTTQQLVANKYPVTDLEEFRQFIVTKLFRSRFRAGTDEAFKQMDAIAARDGFIIMDKERYTILLQNTRGYGLQSRSASGDQDDWMKRGQLLRRLNDFEQSIFQRTRETLLNKKGGLSTVDDELVASKATDVESKIVSSRKKGKEGPVADCVACSCTNVMYGMRLRVKGESQDDNVRELLKTLPAITSSAGESLAFTIDRGYGKFSNVKEIAERKWHITTIAPTVGSRNPFILAEEAANLLQRWVRARMAENRQEELKLLYKVML